MERMGMVLRLGAEHAEEYKRLHADVWPKVLAQIEQSNIRNYSIFYHAGEGLLFGYWEYRGSDFEADMARIAADPVTREWWDVCMPMQQPVATAGEGEWWSMMDQVFFFDG